MPRDWGKLPWLVVAIGRRITTDAARGCIINKIAKANERAAEEAKRDPLFLSLSRRRGNRRC